MQLTLQARPLLLGFAVLILGACSTPAADTTPDGATAEASASERECRPVRGASGSRLRQSICRTKEEWEIADAQEKARQDTQAEFFRRVGENAAQGQGPAFDSP